MQNTKFKICAALPLDLKIHEGKGAALLADRGEGYYSEEVSIDTALDLLDKYSFDKHGKISEKDKKAINYCKERVYYNDASYTIIYNDNKDNTLIYFWMNDDDFNRFIEEAKFIKQECKENKNWNEAKFDRGKDMISLVPPEIMRQIAMIRKYGTKKYKNPDNWKNVSKERYVNAMLRHVLAYIEDPDGVDEESGLPHLAHAACNMAFIFEMERPDWEEIKKHRTVYVKEEFEDECNSSK